MDLTGADALTIWRQVVELDVWMTADEDGQPVVLAFEGQPGKSFSLAFLDRDVAEGVAPMDAVLFRTSLWSALRATPSDVAVLLQPGQVDELVLRPDDIDRIIGRPRDHAPVLSPRDLAITSVTLASVVDGTIVPDAGGTPVGVLLDDADLTEARLTLAAGPSLPIEIDEWTATALVRAAAPFPAGLDIVVGAPKAEEYPALADFRAHYTGSEVSTVGVIVERVSERLVVIVDSDDLDELARLRRELGALAPIPVFVLPRRAAPPRAWELGAT